MKEYTRVWSICVLSAVVAITSCRLDSAKPSLVTVTSQDHPRLFFDQSEVPALQIKAETTHAEMWIPIRDYVESQLGTSPPLSAPSDGDLDTYRNYGNQLVSLAFACIITQDPRYCDLASTYLLTYATWQQWGEDNRRGLGHAHMLLGNALAYDWLYNVLTPPERQTVGRSLARWAQRTYEASAAESYQSAWDNWWRKSYMQNHYWITHSSLGMAGLALLGEDERAQTWVDHATSRMSRVQYILNGIEDGSWHESIPYQTYALTMTLPFMDNLRRIQRTDILPHAYLKNYPDWRLYNYLPNSSQFILAYGDFEWSWPDGRPPNDVLRFTAREYENGYAEWLVQQFMATRSRRADVWATPWYVLEFLYYDPTIAPQAPTSREKTRILPDLEGVIWRTGWGEDDLVFGLKTGAYGGRFAFDTFTRGDYPWELPCQTSGCQFNAGHDHDDTNSFYLYRGGHWLAPENEGVGTYGSWYHNTLLIDGQGQSRPPASRHWSYVEDFIGGDGYLETTANTPGFDYVAADATGRYRHIGGIEDITRHVLFVRPDYFVMLDNVAADSAHEYEWVSHFGDRASIEGNWVRGDAGGGQILGVGIAAPQPFDATIGRDEQQPYVHIWPSSPVDNLRFINVLYPTYGAAWNTKPGLTTLDDNGKAAAVRAQMKDGSGRIDDILLTYDQPVSATTVGPYDYDGQVAFVSRGADGGLEKLFLYGGTFLADQAMGKTLVRNLDKTQPFEATYSDHAVALYGNVPTALTLYAPRAEYLTINGMPWPFVRIGEYISVANAELTFLPLVLRLRFGGS